MTGNGWTEINGDFKRKLWTASDDSEVKGFWKYSYFVVKYIVSFFAFALKFAWNNVFFFQVCFPLEHHHDMDPLPAKRNLEKATCQYMGPRVPKTVKTIIDFKKCFNQRRRCWEKKRYLGVILFRGKTYFLVHFQLKYSYFLVNLLKMSATSSREK